MGERKFMFSSTRGLVSRNKNRKKLWIFTAKKELLGKKVLNFVSAAVVTYERVWSGENKCWHISQHKFRLASHHSPTWVWIAYLVSKRIFRFTLALFCWWKKENNIGIATCTTWNDILRKDVSTWHYALLSVYGKFTHTLLLSVVFPLWHPIRFECVKRMAKHVFLSSYTEQ